MINPYGNYYEPSPGYKYLTNGNAYSTGIYLGKSDKIENWRDTNDEPPTPEEPATEAEYARAAMIMMGVSE